MVNHPQHIGKYAIVKPIGAGIAQVYLARHPRYGQVALKVLPPSYYRNPKAENRFVQEVYLLQRMNHPNILRMYSAGTYTAAGGAIYYYMAIEYQPDGSLYHLLQRSGGRLPEQHALHLAVQIADALAFAHNAGVIHRDLKPSNILLRGHQAILCDFNVARDLERPSTGVGQLGTLAYMSPEQTLGNRSFVRRGSDIYSFGVVFYEALSGYQPRNNPELSDLIVVKLIQQEPLPPLLQVAPHISPAVATVIDRCVTSQRAHRYVTMNHVADELRRAMVQSGYTAPPPARPTTARLSHNTAGKPSMLLVSMIVLMMVSLLVLATLAASML